jgi:hypothetical protein
MNMTYYYNDYFVGVIRTRVSMVVFVPRSITHFSVTAETRGTREPSAINVSYTKCNPYFTSGVIGGTTDQQEYFLY